MGCSPLHIAARIGHVEIGIFLCEHGANVELVDSVSNHSVRDSVLVLNSKAGDQGRLPSCVVIVYLKSFWCA
jgi:ankyrin repeat protein